MVRTLGQAVEEGGMMPSGAAVDTIKHRQGSIGVDADISHVVDAGKMTVRVNLIGLEGLGQGMYGHRVEVAPDIVVHMAIAVSGNDHVINILVLGIGHLQHAGRGGTHIGRITVTDTIPAVFQGTLIGHTVNGGMGQQRDRLAFANAVLVGRQRDSQRIGSVDMQHETVALDDAVRVAISLHGRTGIGNGKGYRVIARPSVGDVERGAGIRHNDIAVVVDQCRADGPAHVVLAEHASTRHQTGEPSHFAGTNRNRTFQFDFADACVADHDHYPALGGTRSAVGGFHVEYRSGNKILGKRMSRVGIDRQAGRRPSIRCLAGSVVETGMQGSDAVVGNHGVGPGSEHGLRMETYRKRVGNLQAIDANVATVENADHLVAVGHRITATMVVAVVFKHAAAVLLPRHFVTRRDVHAVNRIDGSRIGAEIRLAHDLEGRQVARGNIHVQGHRRRNHGRTESQQAVGSLDHATEQGRRSAYVGACLTNVQFSTQTILAHRITDTGGQIRPRGTAVGGNLPRIGIGFRFEAVDVHTQYRAVALANHGGNTYAGQRRTITDIHEHRIGSGSTTDAVVRGKIVDTGIVGRSLGFERTGIFHTAASRSPAIGHRRVGIGHHLAMEGNPAAPVDDGIGPGFHYGHGQDVHHDRVGISRIHVKAYARIVGIHAGVNAERAVGAQAQLVSRGMEQAVHEPVHHMTATIRHMGVKTYFVTGTDGRFDVPVQRKGYRKLLVFFERERYPM